jgi:hypothetical protein
MNRLTKAQARAFRERWRRVNEREIVELRSTPMEVRLQQFNTLLAWAHQFGWTAVLGEGVAEVRERWARLRKAHRAQHPTRKRGEGEAENYPTNNLEFTRCARPVTPGNS